MKVYKVEHKRMKNGSWSWKIVAPNGKCLCENRGLNSLAKSKRSIRALRFMFQRYHDGQILINEFVDGKKLTYTATWG